MTNSDKADFLRKLDRKFLLETKYSELRISPFIILEQCKALSELFSCH
jgi:hypothetical protein